MNNELLKYFNGDELAANVWLSKYAQEGDKTPDDMHRRMAKEFARIEWNYREKESTSNFTELSDYGNKLHKKLQKATPKDINDHVYELFKNFKYIIPQGSIMSNLGNKAVTSLSNCFVIGQPTDSYGGICKKDEEMVQLMKRRGGVGIDLSTLRPAKTKVSNAAKTSTGVVSFMHRYSNSTREVAQDGRRGALMLSININHPDSLDFIKIKRDLSQVTGANISVKISEEFMRAVENDEDYVLRFPCNLSLPDADENDFEAFLYAGDYDKLFKTQGRYFKKIKAKEYWNEIIKSAHGSAEPGIIFEDNHHNYSPDGVYSQFKGITTNPCFSYETKILTAHGYEKIGDLEGQDIDFVNKDGKIVSGTVFKSGEKATYTLNLSNKEIIVTTIDHKFMLTDGSEKQAQFITKEDRLMPFFIINDKTNEFVKYGFIQGDGCTGRLDSTAHLGMEVNIGEKDGDIANLFNVKNTGKNYLGGFNEILKELGFNSSVLPNRTLPTTFNNWDSDNKLMFLKGLWSANGSIIKGHRIAFKSTCKELILELSKVLQEFGIDSYFTTNKAKEVEFSNGIYLCKESYDLNISKYNAVLKFAENIGFVHNYKQDSLKELILAKAPKILSAKVTEVKSVYDFSLNDDTHWGVIQGVIAHNCGEIFMQENDACRLIATNYFSFVVNPFTKEAKFDFEKFYKVNYEAMRLSDDLIDLEIEHIDRILRKIAEDPEPFEDRRTEFELWTKIKETATASRRTGLGFTALGDTLAALGLKYDSDEGIKIIEQISKTKMESELDCTIDLAILRGTFTGWNKNLEQPFNEINDETLFGNEFYKSIFYNFHEQWKRMQKYGRRNVSWSTVAPTGTVSLMSQTTSGIEPLFSPYYFRRKKINPNDEGVRVDFTDQNGDKWQEFPVLHPKFKDWIVSLYDTDNPLWWECYGLDMDKLYQNIPTVPETKELLQKFFENSPYYKSTANDIDWVKRVEIQGIIQKYITHSISSTINLPNSVTEAEVGEIYIESWKKGLKGITVYRDGSRSGVLITESTKDKTDTFEYKDAPKRPKDLEADVHNINVKGVHYNVIVGLLNGKPYEIFIDDSDNKMSGKGIVFKKSKGNYYFKKDDITTDITSNMSDEQVAISRLVSISLRHGADIKFISEQLLKCKGDLFSFTKSLVRVLKKYIPDGSKSTITCNDCGSNNVIFEEGCSKCLDCGSSRCG